MLRGASNPNAYMQQLAVNNPQIRQVLELSQKYKTPQSAFYALAEQKGINPDEFIQELLR